MYYYAYGSQGSGECCFGIRLDILVVVKTAVNVRIVVLMFLNQELFYLLKSYTLTKVPIFSSGLTNGR